MYKNPVGSRTLKITLFPTEWSLIQKPPDMIICHIISITAIENIKSRPCTYHEIEDSRFVLDFSVQWQNWVNEKIIFCSVDEANLTCTLQAFKMLTSLKNKSMVSILYCFPVNIIVLSITGYVKTIVFS